MFIPKYYIFSLLTPKTTHTQTYKHLLNKFLPTPLPKFLSFSNLLPSLASSTLCFIPTWLFYFVSWVSDWVVLRITASLLTDSPGGILKICLCKENWYLWECSIVRCVCNAHGLHMIRWSHVVIHVCQEKSKFHDLSTYRKCFSYIDFISVYKLYVIMLNSQVFVIKCSYINNCIFKIISVFMFIFNISIREI